MHLGGRFRNPSGFGVGRKNLNLGASCCLQSRQPRIAQRVRATASNTQEEDDDELEEEGDEHNATQMKLVRHKCNKKYSQTVQSFPVRSQSYDSTASCSITNPFHQCGCSTCNVLT